MVLETCPNIYSLGYLVFAAAGLKQVFGYEEKADTKFTEIFYRGPSDQKLSTIGEAFSLVFTLTVVRTLINGPNYSQLLSQLGDDVPRQ